MANFNFDKEKISRNLYIFLLGAASVLVFILAIGTIIGVARPRGSDPLIVFGGSQQVSIVNLNEDDIRIFAGLGRLRIPLSNQSTMVISVEFPYYAGDISFTEELAAKTGSLRNDITLYFSSLPEENIIQIDEDIAKAEIIKKFNTTLRLGRIEALFFSDMMIIDAAGN
ncbi:MAG: hypothetical protein FWD28_07115 [Treponema sp.]|nr:hypothetical protein [Treponema sp.]